jgi:hypothetical protein
VDASVGLSDGLSNSSNKDGFVHFETEYFRQAKVDG